MSLLEVNNLRVHFATGKGVVKAVNDVSFSLEQGKTLCIVGESGSGKSVSAMSVLRLLDENGYIDSGEILFDERGDGQKIDLTKLPFSAMDKLRGDRISVVFQEPMTALNPVLTVKRQLCEPFIFHRGLTKKEAEKAAFEALHSVHIPDPARVLKSYSHQLSGGMRQRVMIAMALACKPKILIADEPTTALDVTVQAQILRLMRELQKENGAAILFITHDLGVVNEMADDVAVMYCGQIVERAAKEEIFSALRKKTGESGADISHPYTEGLMRSMPSANTREKRLDCITGNVPHPLRLPIGCKFSTRCMYCTEKCIAEEPALAEIESGRFIRCFYPNKEQRQSEEHRKAVVRRQT